MLYVYRKHTHTRCYCFVEQESASAYWWFRAFLWAGRERRGEGQETRVSELWMINPVDRCHVQPMCAPSRSLKKKVKVFLNPTVFGDKIVRDSRELGFIFLWVALQIFSSSLLCLPSVHRKAEVGGMRVGRREDALHRYRTSCRARFHLWTPLL